MKKFIVVLVAMLLSMAMLTSCSQKDDESLDEGTEGAKETTEDIAGLAEEFIRLLSEGNYGEATENFDETMNEALSVTDLQELWESLQLQVGEFIDQEHEGIQDAEDYQIVLINGLFAGADLTFSVTFNKNGKIAGFFIQ